MSTPTITIIPSSPDQLGCARWRRSSPKGYIDPAVLDSIIEHYETKTGPQAGPAVARAWVDPQFKAALLEDATKAIAALGIDVAIT